MSDHGTQVELEPDELDPQTLHDTLLARQWAAGDPDVKVEIED